MNYADFDWELAPKTGMFDVVRAMESLAKELGVKFSTNANIEKIIVENTCLQENGERIELIWFEVITTTKRRRAERIEKLG
jgi:phytoene desaturase